VGHVPEPHTLEGGDFLPAGPDLCFLGVRLFFRSACVCVQPYGREKANGNVLDGACVSCQVGPRTSEGAAQYLMDNDLFGTRRVAVVKDVFERSQKHMHLVRSSCRPRGPRFYVGRYSPLVR
jgi:arginine deiminase